MVTDMRKLNRLTATADTLIMSRYTVIMTRAFCGDRIYNLRLTTAPRRDRCHILDLFCPHAISDVGLSTILWETIDQFVAAKLYAR
jgi:hypothetical protein